MVQQVQHLLCKFENPSYPSQSQCSRLQHLGGTGREVGSLGFSDPQLNSRFNERHQLKEIEQKSGFITVNSQGNLKGTGTSSDPSQD